MRPPLTSCSAHGPLPDSGCTPGVADPALTQPVICDPSWHTSDVRPPTSYTDRLKLQLILAYGYADKDPSHYELDHLVSLQLGGAPTDPRNLWPQPYNRYAPQGEGAEAKDGLERYLHNQVCGGHEDLTVVQDQIRTDWVSAWVAAGKPRINGAPEP